MLNALINIFIPIAILLTLSSENRLGPIPAVLLAVGIPAIWGIYGLARTRKVNFQSLLGVISVLMTGVIAVFELDTGLFPIKEAVIPIGFAIVLLASNRTSYPLVKLLCDMVQRKEHVEREVRDLDRQQVYRLHIERSGMFWAGIMTLSGIMKFALSSVIINAPAGSEKFNTELALYQLVQIPTTMLITMVLILSLIWYIGKGTGRIIDLPPSEVLRGGERIASIFARVGRFRPTRQHSA